MRSETIFPLRVLITGKPVGGDNPGWAGQVSADTPFAVLLSIRNGFGTWWAKSEVECNGVPISVLLHPNGDGTAVQFLYTLGYGCVDNFSAPTTKSAFQPPTPARLQFQAGELQTFCTMNTEPETIFKLFFLSRTNVYPGRTGVWCPHRALRGKFPSTLEPVLFGPRRGMYLLPGNAESATQNI